MELFASSYRVVAFSDLIEYSDRSLNFDRVSFCIPFDHNAKAMHIGNFCSILVFLCTALANIWLKFEESAVLTILDACTISHFVKCGTSSPKWQSVIQNRQTCQINYHVCVHFYLYLFSGET